MEIMKGRDTSKKYGSSLGKVHNRSHKQCALGSFYDLFKNRNEEKIVRA
jgi:hypothetical protein